MPKRRMEPDIVEEIEAFKKRDLAHRNTIAKQIDRLDARYIALRATEKAIGGNMAGAQPRSK